MGKRSHWSRKSRYTCSHDQKWVFFVIIIIWIIFINVFVLDIIIVIVIIFIAALVVIIANIVGKRMITNFLLIVTSRDINQDYWPPYHLEMRSLFFYPLFPLSIDSFLWESPLERSLSKHGHNVIDTLWRHEAHPHNKIYFTFPPFLFLLDLIIVTAVFN